MRSVFVQWTHSDLHYGDARLPPKGDVNRAGLASGRTTARGVASRRHDLLGSSTRYSQEYLARKLAADDQ